MVRTGQQKRQERRLPVQQMMVLALARFGEPLAFTSVLPYLPEMIESLNVPEDQVARWAGIAVSMFPLAQTLTAVPWGRASDRYGRKPIIMLGLTSTMITSLLWGFSRSVWMAIIVRALAGAGNGNVGIIRTAVAEMVPWKELQPRAFSVMPLVWNIGSIFGPMLGGALANPMGVKPGEPLRPNASLLEKFPYALPNIIAASIFILGILTGILFLEETLSVKRDQRDYGLLLGDKIKRAAKNGLRKLQRDSLHGHEHSTQQEPLLKPPASASASASDVEYGMKPKPKKTPPPPSLREVLHYQSVLNLLVYTLLALHSITFDQLIPVFMHHPRQDHSSSNPDFRPPFKFSGGFGLNSRQIGFIFTLYGVSGMLVQFFVFPPVARKYGVLRCLRACACVMPCVYLITPFSALLPDQTGQQVVISALMLVKSFCTTFAFPSSTILLTNSATSLRILGTLNGLATSCGALGRAVGPLTGGSVFTLGVQKGYIIMPWWILSAISTVAAVPAFWLIEGEGFGGNDEVVDDSDDDENDTPTNVVPTEDTARSVAREEQHEEGYGAIGPLISRTNTVSSAGLSEAYEEDYTSDDEAHRRITRQASGSLRRMTSRKFSAPIGMNRPIGRSYSTNLGQSFGSAGSYN